MSEWLPLFAVFWGLYLLDGLVAGRRERLHLHAWLGSLRARVATSVWHLPPPLPGAWSLTVDDLPASLSADGLTNWPSASAKRPPPLPDKLVTFAWADVTEVRRRQGWITVNGRRFCPATAALDADGLRALVSRLVPLDRAARVAALDDWETSRWHRLRTERRLRLALGRSRTLAALNTLQTLLLLAITAWLLLDGPSRVAPELADRVARALPWWAVGYGLLHLMAVNEFRLLHRRLFPKAGAERGNLVFTALMVPAQALRLRLHLVRGVTGAAHPVVAALAAGPRTAVAALAAATLRDIEHPFLPAGQLPADSATIARDAATRVRGRLLAVLDETAREDLAPAALLAAPRPHSADACAYCPRCHDQFVRPDARCHLGTPLKSFAKPVAGNVTPPQDVTGQV